MRTGGFGNQRRILVWAALTKIPWPGWLIEHLCLTILQAETKVPTEEMSANSPLPGSKMALFSLRPHMASGKKTLRGLS